MRKETLTLIIFLHSFFLFSQKGIDIGTSTCLRKDTVFKQALFYDFFRQKTEDMTIILVGNAVLLYDMQPISNNELPEFEIKSWTDGNRYLQVSYKGMKMYTYQLRKQKVDGMACCYEAMTSRILVLSEFKRGKLNGKTYLFSPDGELKEIIKFKSGRYVKHVFHTGASSRKALRKLSRNVRVNPLNDSGFIYLF